MVATTFSNTVMVQAALVDSLPGPRLGSAFAELGACIGGAVVITPLLESLIYKATGHLRFPYLGLSALGALNLAYTLNHLPETLVEEKRKPVGDVVSLSMFNPFGFSKIYTKGSAALQRESPLHALFTLPTLASTHSAPRQPRM